MYVYALGSDNDCPLPVAYAYTSPMWLVFINDKSDDNFEMKSKYHSFSFCSLIYSSNVDFSRSLLFGICFVLYTMQAPCRFVVLNKFKKDRVD